MNRDEQVAIMRRRPCVIQLCKGAYLQDPAKLTPAVHAFPLKPMGAMVYFNRAPAIERPRWEPRAKWPRSGGCAAPHVPVKGDCGVQLHIEVRHLEGRKHLPIFRLRKAA